MFCQSFYPNTTLLSARTNEPNRFQVLIAIFHIIQGSTALILVLQERIRTVEKKKIVWRLGINTQLMLRSKGSGHEVILRNVEEARRG